MKHLKQVADNKYIAVDDPDVGVILYVAALFIYVILVLSRSIPFQTVKNQPVLSPVPDKVYAAEATPIPTPSIKTLSPEELKEFRIKKTYDYLLKLGSPLAPHAKHIVAMADKYDIPWTLVTAISGKESTYGKNIKPNSFNAWGIMKFDANGNRSIRTFESWESGIEFTSRLLSENYRKNMNKAIQEKYCPSIECSDTWVSDITNFQMSINK